MELCAATMMGIGFMGSNVEDRRAAAGTTIKVARRRSVEATRNNTGSLWARQRHPAVVAACTEIDGSFGSEDRRGE
jgi:predicted dinucleotide-binding enzyme